MSENQEESAPEVLKDVEINIKTMLKAGAHYGHQTPRWNPKMLPFIFGERNGIHIINLDLTLKAWERARKYIADISGRGGSVLFVGTKLQAQECIQDQADRSNSFHVTSRWLGGTLSNFETIKRSIDRMNKLEDLLRKADDEESEVKLNKKEKLQITRDLEKLEANLGGIRNMKKLPDIVFVVDIGKESIAIAEARKLHIPVVALVDTNANPAGIEFPIPCNDDATRTINLFAAGVADAVLEGKEAYLARMPKSETTVGEGGKVESEKKADKNGTSETVATNGDAGESVAPATTSTPAAG